MDKKSTPGKGKAVRIAKPYTVILILPDTIAENYGEDYYFGRVRATSPAEAATIAQADAADVNQPDGCNCGSVDPNDFLCVAVFEGHHDNMLPQA